MTFKEILEATAAESAQRQSKDSIKSLKVKVRDLPPTRGFARGLRSHNFSIIAEVKMKSPSMGRMTTFAGSAAEAAPGIYNKHPVVSAISVLTQKTHFGGSPDVLRFVRQKSNKPILRKDFIRDEYEVYYSRCIGADAILLMTNVVSEPKEFEALHALATELGMDVLCEVHSEDEIALLPSSVKICGINSRKFKSDGRFGLSRFTRHLSMDATVDRSAFELYDKLPGNCLKIAESGVTKKNIADIISKYDFDAALIGTALLQAGRFRMQRELDIFQEEVGKVKKTSLSTLGSTADLVSSP